MFNPGRGLFLFPGVRPANQFGRIEKEKESSRLILKSPVTNLETEFLSSIPRNPLKRDEAILKEALSGYEVHCS